MEKHFLNLTNGIEAVNFNDFNIKELNFMYVASTTIERKNWIKLFQDLDHNFLFNLSIGNKVIFYDFGTNRKNSKTCYLGINLIRYVLTRFWLGENDDNLCYRNTRSSNDKLSEVSYFNNIYESLFIYDMNRDKVNLKTKLKKYKNKFLITKSINLTYISRSTTHDGDYEFYKKTIKENLI